jgi:hypothetical protein
MQKIFLKPGEKISQLVQDHLAQANKKYSTTKNFPGYLKDIGHIFGLQPFQPTERNVQFLGGFVEGEGSLNVGAKKNTTSRFKVYLDPIFSVTQHVNGINVLYQIMCYLKAGRLRYKKGSNATIFFEIDNRRTLKEKVLPFYAKYVVRFGSPFKKKRYETFKKLLELFEERAHLNFDKMVNEVLPLYDSIRCQIDQKNQSFVSLQDAQDYVRAANAEFEINDFFKSI